MDMLITRIELLYIFFKNKLQDFCLQFVMLCDFYKRSAKFCNCLHTTIKLI